MLAAPVDLHKDYKKHVPLKSPKKTQIVPAKPPAPAKKATPKKSKES
jgi:hypothetical protein